MKGSSKGITNAELRDFIDWEGGVESALQHGLNDEIKDPKTKTLWDACVEAYKPFEAAQEALSKRLKY